MNERRATRVKVSLVCCAASATCTDNCGAWRNGSAGLSLGTMFLQTRMRAASGTPFGMLLVAEEFHVDNLGDADGNENLATAAVNLHIEGERANPDIITIPDDQLIP